MKSQCAAVRAQQGISTLLMSSLTLSVAMVFVLTSYSTSFYQVKRAQNTVFSRQAFWLAEGALACGFGLLAEHYQRQPVSTDPPAFSDSGSDVCQSTQGDGHMAVQIAPLADGRYQVSAEARVAGKARVRLQHIAVVRVCNSGAEPLSASKEQEQECVALGSLPQAQERLVYQVRWLRGTWHDV
ncbi:hypothetical protein [Photobacterium halotolerans]|uniref:MSHA biogenesis protein MshP n=1 Tax=Photobacterium halotolerans TaxID=265726 RepID=A0A7X4WA10_9GAMM|nr:hypothetical protein [Photobacterium halotolerans]NAW64941.1 hypothetical protein [Photobacterium halotolerans]